MDVVNFQSLNSRFKAVTMPSGSVVLVASGSSTTGGRGGAGAGAAAGAGRAAGKAGKGKGKKGKDKGEVVLGADGKPLTKKQLRMLAREKAAAAAKAASASADNYGDLPMIRSTTITGRTWTRVEALVPSAVGAEVLVRARLHNVRDQGQCVFLTLRQGFSTVQACLFKSKQVTKAMLRFAAEIPKESMVDVKGTLTATPKPVESVTQSSVEVSAVSVHVVSRAAPELPFQLDVASRPLAEGEVEAVGGEGEEEDAKHDDTPTVTQFTRLNNRWIDLRTPASQGIMRISSMVCTLFREFLLKQDFVEFQSPKLIGGASEGGASVFRLKYFGRDACLAQSPQLYKQMIAACSDFERVFEVGPVFRAEDSNTHRHLCEFHGLDMEMAINEHYYEVLDVFSDLFVFIFDELNKRCKPEIEAVRKQYPFKDLKYHRPTFRITYAEGMKLLQDAGHDVDPMGDLDTPSEKALGKIVSEKYGTDFFFMDKYPMSVRPFYTMPDPENPLLSNSYDFFIRGEEILSGAQRVHDPELLTKQAIGKGIPVDTIKPYIDSFRHGALPHGGGGVGLERVVMLFLGLPNIRKSSMFPRDPKRLAP